MFAFFLAAALVFFAMLIVGLIWGLAERGKTTTRSGPEIGAELMAEKMARESFREGKTPIFTKVFSRGTGWAVETEAEYSYREIRRRFREGDIRPILPALLGMSGFLGFFLFLGLTLLAGLSNKLYGTALLAFFAYSVYVLISGLIREG